MVIRSAELWGGLFWLALGAFVTWSGSDLGLGQLRDPGSGFFLFYLGLMMMGLSLAIITNAFREPGESVAALWSGTRWMRVSAVVVLLLAYGFLFEPVGFLITSTVLLLVLMIFVDRVDLRAAIPLSILVPLGCWYVITHVLKIQLPPACSRPGSDRSAASWIF